MTARYFESYDPFGNRTGVWEQGAFEPDEQFERRVRRQLEARELAELNERLRRADRELKQVRRLAEQGVDDGGPDDDGSGYSETSDTHGPAFTLAHVHGRYSKHAHYHSADHSDAPINPGGAIAAINPDPADALNPSSSSSPLSEPRRQQQRALVERLVKQGIMTASEAAPITSQYQRRPGIEDEADVRADDGTDDQEDGTLESETADNTHAQFTGVHAHGKFGLHGHYGEANHRLAPLKAAGSQLKSGNQLGKNY